MSLVSSGQPTSVSALSIPRQEDRPCPCLVVVGWLGVYPKTKTPHEESVDELELTDTVLIQGSPLRNWGYGGGDEERTWALGDCVMQLGRRMNFDPHLDSLRLYRDPPSLSSPPPTPSLIWFTYGKGRPGRQKSFFLWQEEQQHPT